MASKIAARVRRNLVGKCTKEPKMYHIPVCMVAILDAINGFEVTRLQGDNLIRLSGLLDPPKPGCRHKNNNIAMINIL